MALEPSYPHIEKTATEPARLTRIPRVRVAQIAMDYLAYGWSPDKMCRQHPYLTPAEVHAAMAYYYDHSDEIDSEVRCELAEVDARRGELAGSPLRTRLLAMAAAG
jgi:uncharacterized protein (DUF433 family)